MDTTDNLSQSSMILEQNTFPASLSFSDFWTDTPSMWSSKEVSSSGYPVSSSLPVPLTRTNALLRDGNISQRTFANSTVESIRSSTLPVASTKLEENSSLTESFESQREKSPLWCSENINEIDWDREMNFVNDFKKVFLDF